MSFPQPIIDKSLVNYDIRGARSNFIEREIKQLEREHKSPPKPEKLKSDYVISTRFGMNPNAQKAQINDFQVSMPQGQSPFDSGGKKHYQSQQGEIKQLRSLENPWNLPQNYEFSKSFCVLKPYYPRNLNIKDIDGTNPGTLISKAVINKENAKKAIEQNILLEESKNNQQERDPYQAYQDALDKFKSEINGGGGNIYRDRAQNEGINMENPYAQVENYRYKQNDQENRYESAEDETFQFLEREKEREKERERQYEMGKERERQYEREKIEEKEKFEERQRQYEREVQQQRQRTSDRESKYKLQSSSQYPDQQVSQRYGSQSTQNLSSYQQQIPQSYGNYPNYQPSFSGYNPRIAQDQGDYQNHIRTSSQQQQNSQNYQRDVPSSVKFGPTSKLNQQNEIISHAMNNVSPQITKQQLGPQLNVEGYVANKQGSRMNPTSMSYGSESGPNSLILRHNLLGNQIVAEPPVEYPTRLPHTRDGRVNGAYKNIPLNIKQFEKYPGEFKDNVEMPKNVTNSALFRGVEKAGPPQSSMGGLLKNTQTFYRENERNLEHYKNNNPNKIPNPPEIPHARFEETSNKFSSQLAANPLPYGAPFSYNPNEHRKQQMVSLNHQKQLEKIERSIDVNDKNISSIQHSVPDIQQPHIKKTLYQPPYSQDFQSQQQDYYEKFDQRQLAGIGNYYGDQYQQQSQQKYPKDEQQRNAEEFLQKHGAKALRNLSNVKIF